VKDPESAPGRQDAFGHHSSNAGHFLADLRSGKRREAGRIDVTMRKVPQQIAGGPDAQTGESFGAPLAYAFEKLDWSVQPERCPYGTGRHPC
jgi:hypothetical protein